MAHWRRWWGGRAYWVFDPSSEGKYSEDEGGYGPTFLHINATHIEQYQEADFQRSAWTTIYPTGSLGTLHQIFRLHLVDEDTASLMTLFQGHDL